MLIEARENADTGTIVTNVVNFGSQIPVEERSDIFRRFVKGRSGPGTESGGTGIGLSIARWAAQLHGGTVRVVETRAARISRSCCRNTISPMTSRRPTVRARALL